MSTQPQILANRLNAQKSTGPTTPQGKTIVSQNALKHGLSARHDVITTESQADFDLHRDALLAELDPLSPMESILADRIVSLSWRLKRADQIQNQAIDALHEESTAKPFPALARLLTPENQDPALILGRIALKDFSNERVLDRLLMYERRIEHSLYKTTLELQRLRLLRTLEPPIPHSQHNLAPGFTGGSPQKSSENQASSTQSRESSIKNHDRIAQNKPNFQIPKTNTTPCTPCHSDRSPAGAKRRNLLQHSRPSQTTELAQCAAESFPVLRKTNPIPLRQKTNANPCSAKNYEQKPPPPHPKKTNPNKPNSPVPPGRDTTSDIRNTRYKPNSTPPQSRRADKSGILTIITGSDWMFTHFLRFLERPEPAGRLMKLRCDSGTIPLVASRSVSVKSRIPIE